MAMAAREAKALGHSLLSMGTSVFSTMQKTLISLGSGEEDLDEEDELFKSELEKLLASRWVKFAAVTSPWRVWVRKTFFPIANIDIERFNELGRQEQLRKKSGNLNQKLIVPPKPEKIPFNWFEALMYFVIVLNIIALAVQDPTTAKRNAKENKINSAFDRLEFFFATFFAVEQLLRIIAFGKEAAIEDAGTIIDLIVVVAGVATVAISTFGGSKSPSLSVLRTMKVLRPLRTVSNQPALKSMVSSILQSFTYLSGVLTVYAMFLLGTGIAFVGIFRGKLKGRCVADNYINFTNATLSSGVVSYGRSLDAQMSEAFSNFDRWNATFWHQMGWSNGSAPLTAGSLTSSVLPVTTPSPSSTTMVPGFNPLNVTAQPTTPDSVKWKLISEAYNISYFVCESMFSPKKRMDCSSQQVCDLEQKSSVFKGFRCPYGFSCARIQNPNYDMIGFDSLPESTRTLFSIVTLEGWHETFYYMIDGASFLSAIFIVVVVVFGAFFIVNLTVGIVTIRFSEAKRRLESFQQIKTAAEEEAEHVAYGNGLPDFRRKLFHFINGKFYYYLMSVITLVSIVIVALEHEGMSEWQSDLGDKLSYVFIVFFAIELVLGLLVYRSEYFKKLQNISDCAVLVCSCMAAGISSLDLDWIRAMKVTRIFKLISKIDNLRHWATVLTRSLVESSLLVAISGFVLFIFATLCMSVLGGNMCGLEEDDPYIRVTPDSNNVVDVWCRMRPRANFDNIGFAMITSFQIMTGCNWNDIMYNAVRALNNPLISILFIGFFSITNYVLLNLFVGIVVSTNQQLSRNETEPREILTKEQRMQLRQQAVLNVLTGKGNSRDLLDTGPGRQRPGVHEPNTEAEILDPPAAPSTNVMTELEIALASTEEGSFRYKLLKGITHWSWEWFIFTSIILTCVLQFFDNPITAPDSNYQLTMRVFMMASSIFYIVETLVYALALGRAYPKNPWNLFDVVITIATVFASAMEYAGFRRMSLALRCVLPLRLIRHMKGVQTVCNALLSSAVTIVEVLFLAGVVWAAFGVVGVQLFMGKLGSCEIINGDPANTTLARYDKFACEASGNKWSVYRANFDHLGYAFLVLFEVSTLDGWSSIMYRTMDTSRDKSYFTLNATSGKLGENRPGPTFNANVYVAGVYFVTFVLIGAFFLVNLFVSVLMDTYDSQKREPQSGKIIGSILLTPEQRAWVENHNSLLRGLPTVSYKSNFQQGAFGRLRHTMFTIVRLSYFEWFVNSMVILNFVFMALEHDGQPAKLDLIQRISDIFFACFFMIEVAMRLLAEGNNFFHGKWNRFDFTVGVLGIVNIISVANDSGQFVRPFRGLRVLRALKVVRTSRRIRLILTAFLTAAVSLGNVCALLLIVMLVYAVLGVTFYGRTQQDDNTNHHAHFFSLLDGLLLMFRLVTGGNWPDIMDLFRYRPDKCDASIGGCPVRYTAVPFFVSFSIVGKYMILSLFTAVIVDTVQSSEATAARSVKQRDVKLFFIVWQYYDPQLEFRLPFSKCMALLDDLAAKRSPLSYEGRGDWRMRKIRKLNFVTNLGLQVENGFVTLRSLMIAVARNALQLPLDESKVEVIQRQADMKFGRVVGSFDYVDTVINDVIPADQLLAVYLFAELWRRKARQARARIADRNFSQGLSDLLANSPRMLKERERIRKMALTEEDDEPFALHPINPLKYAPRKFDEADELEAADPDASNKFRFQRTHAQVWDEFKRQKAPKPPILKSGWSVLLGNVNKRRNFEEEEEQVDDELSRGWISNANDNSPKASANVSRAASPSTSSPPRHPPVREDNTNEDVTDAVEKVEQLMLYSPLLTTEQKNRFGKRNFVVLSGNKIDPQAEHKPTNLMRPGGEKDAQQRQLPQLQRLDEDGMPIIASPKSHRSFLKKKKPKGSGTIHEDAPIPRWKALQLAQAQKDKEDLLKQSEMEMMLEAEQRRRALSRRGAYDEMDEFEEQRAREEFLAALPRPRAVCVVKTEDYGDVDVNDL